MDHKPNLNPTLTLGNGTNGYYSLTKAGLLILNSLEIWLNITLIFRETFLGNVANGD